MFVTKNQFLYKNGHFINEDIAQIRHFKYRTFYGDLKNVIHFRNLKVYYFIQNPCKDRDKLWI